MNTFEQLSLVFPLVLVDEIIDYLDCVSDLQVERRCDKHAQ